MESDDLQNWMYFRDHEPSRWSAGLRPGSMRVSICQLAGSETGAPVHGTCAQTVDLTLAGSTVIYPRIVDPKSL